MIGERGLEAEIARHLRIDVINSVIILLISTVVGHFAAHWSQNRPESAVAPLV